MEMATVRKEGCWDVVRIEDGGGEGKGKGRKGKVAMEGRRGERWFECLAYRISFTLLLCFSASAIAVAPGSSILLPVRLHGLQ